MKTNMRNDRDILFDIEKLGYKYEFDGKNVILNKGCCNIRIGKLPFSDSIDVSILNKYKDIYHLEKDDIKKKRVEHHGVTYTHLPPQLILHIYELLNYYIKEGFYENNN